MEFNNDYDSQSDFSSRSIKGMHILYNNSYYYEKEKLMYYNNAKLENTKNQYNFENFVNEKEKLKIEDKEDSEKEIYYINDNKRKNSVTASTEHQRTISKTFEIKKFQKKAKFQKKTNIIKKEVVKERIQHPNHPNIIKIVGITLEIE